VREQVAYMYIKDRMTGISYLFKLELSQYLSVSWASSPKKTQEEPADDKRAADDEAVDYPCSTRPYLMIYRYLLTSLCMMPFLHKEPSAIPGNSSDRGVLKNEPDHRSKRSTGHVSEPAHTDPIPCGSRATPYTE
jgi:hypothetical protein